MDIIHTLSGGNTLETIEKIEFIKRNINTMNESNISKIIGTRTYDVLLYHPFDLEELAPVDYRNGQKDELKYPPEDIIINLVENRNEEYNEENVALVPSIEQMDQWKNEYEKKERSVCPAVIFDTFYSLRVVGTDEVSSLYTMVVSKEHEYDYSWNADYYEQTVSITVSEV